jgi:hypothetical protein
MMQAGIFDLYVQDNIHGIIDDALDRASDVLGILKLGGLKDFLPTVKREMNK